RFAGEVDLPLVGRMPNGRAHSPRHPGTRAVGAYLGPGHGRQGGGYLLLVGGTCCYALLLILLTVGFIASDTDDQFRPGWTPPQQPLTGAGALPIALACCICAGSATTMARL